MNVSRRSNGSSGGRTDDALNDIDKSRIVEEGNYHKFTKSKNDPKMLQKLLATGEREMIEVRYLVPQAR